MVRGCDRNQHGERRGVPVVGLSDTHGEGTAVCHGGALSKAHDQGGVLGPRGEDVVNGGVGKVDRPNRCEGAFVNGDVVGFNGRCIVFHGQGDVDALSGDGNDVLNINAQENRGVGRCRCHHG